MGWLLNMQRWKSRELQLQVPSLQGWKRTLAHDLSDEQIHVEPWVTELCQVHAKHHNKSSVVGVWSPALRSPDAPSILPAEGGAARGRWRGCARLRGDALGGHWFASRAWVPAAAASPAPAILWQCHEPRAQSVVLILIKLVCTKSKCLQALRLWGGILQGIGLAKEGGFKWCLRCNCANNFY